MIPHYILFENGEMQEVDMTTYLAWLSVPGNRIVATDEFPDGTYVSTVFLGFDHSHGHGPPQFFETMIFDNENLEGHVCRYSTKAEALEGHEAGVVMVKRLTNRMISRNFCMN